MKKDIIKLAIADDETLFRQGITFILDKENNIEICIQAENGNDLIKQLDLARELPEVILMDLKMPDLNGVETTKIVKKKFPEIKIIALTSYYSKPFIINMIQQGAVAYLAKNATPTEVVNTINQVAIKGFYYDDNVMSILEEASLKTKKQTRDDEYLTNREREVLKLICEQKTTTEIAEQLFISPRTVEGHRNNLLVKTGSKNIAGLVIHAIENQIFVRNQQI
ncbi:two component transcriptional regulator, LuxR family [Aquimarina amphilecti]|uniref:Two component transcriptional regulator, LuxR family n=1 Tax=Aquimarina amphilecti TaxID=1038014 RepID=A0A1H7FVX9_AQUAM|nr:response regulator transcription factor [Aquimarina amphilecti]SEK28350.1 two component transcriptional regulator, LuxR family [Aquimarina amphilecti]